MRAVEVASPRPDSRHASAAGQRRTAPTVGRFVNLGATLGQPTGRHDKALRTTGSAPARFRARPGPLLHADSALRQEEATNG